MDTAVDIPRKSTMGILGCLSKCHIVVSLMMLILGGLADYVSHRMNTLRFHGLAEICGFYFFFMGVIGIFGSASHRRGLLITFLIMGFHSVFIMAPAAIISSSFDIHFYRQECWGECDWHLLSASLPKNSRCQILCGDEIDENRRRYEREGTDYRLDAGLISLAGVELLLSVATIALCAKWIFSSDQQERSGDSLVAIATRANTSISAAGVEMQPLRKTDDEEPV